MNLPNPPTTRDDGLNMWLTRLYFAVRGMWLRNGPDYFIERTTDGTFIKFPPSAAGLSVSSYRYKSMSADHLVCRTYNGTTEGSTDVLIAKPRKLRNAITTETLRGVVVNYSAWDNTANGQTRIATQAGGSVVETQYITPPYLVNDLVWAVSTYTGVNVPNTNPAQAMAQLDINVDAREWAAF